MAERPILFSGEMVRAILAGRKTQTRRVVKPQPHPNHVLSPAWGTSPDGFEYGEKHLWIENGPDYPDGPEDERRCPYGAPGDTLWVREGFAPVDAHGHKCAVRDAAFVVLSDGAQVYRDGVVIPGLPTYAVGVLEGIKWRPSIHMPRWASRITLAVKSVRLERLQDISEADAREEGVELCGDDCGDARSHLQALWDRINGKRAGFAWRDNPWVWAIEFERRT